MFRPAPDVSMCVDLEAHLLRLYSQWQSAANRPPLLGAVYLGEMSNGKPAFSRLDARDRKFAPQAWPASLAFYREVPDRRLRMPEGGLPYFPRGFAFELIEARPVLIFPLVETRGRPGELPPGPPPPPPCDDWQRPPPSPMNEPPRPPRQLRDLMIPAPANQPLG